MAPPHRGLIKEADMILYIVLFVGLVIATVLIVGFLAGRVAKAGAEKAEETLDENLDGGLPKAPEPGSPEAEDALKRSGQKGPPNK